eukprot:13928933-Alexandrium_andersonii.AAC.1
MQMGQVASAGELVTTTTVEDSDEVNYVATLFFLSILLNVVALASALLGCACFMWSRRSGARA